MEGLRRELGTLRASVAEARGMVDVALVQQKVEDFEMAAAQEGFWDDAPAAQRHLRELEKEKGMLERVGKWDAAIGDCDTIRRLCARFPSPLRLLLSPRLFPLLMFLSFFLPFFLLSPFFDLPPFSSFSP